MNLTQQGELCVAQAMLEPLSPAVCPTGVCVPTANPCSGENKSSKPHSWTCPALLLRRPAVVAVRSSTEASIHQVSTRTAIMEGYPCTGHSDVTGCWQLPVLTRAAVSGCQALGNDLHFVPGFPNLPPCLHIMSIKRFFMEIVLFSFSHATFKNTAATNGAFPQHLSTFCSIFWSSAQPSQVQVLRIRDWMKAEQALPAAYLASDPLPPSPSATKKGDGWIAAQLLCRVPQHPTKHRHRIM